MDFFRQLVFYNDLPHLLHLIWLAFASFRLEINDFFDSAPEENVVTSANPLLEVQSA
jgi:hypothetical protein